MCILTITRRLDDDQVYNAGHTKAIAATSCVSTTATPRPALDQSELAI